MIRSCFPGRRRGVAHRVVAVLFSAAFAAFPLQLSARENSSLIYGEGAALAAGGDIDGAITMFRKSAELSPRYALAHYGLGRAYLHKEKMRADAIRELTTAISCDPKMAKAYFYLGVAYMFDMKYDRAILSFGSAYRIDERFIESLYNIGAIYDLIGQPQKARQYFGKYFYKLNAEGGEF